MNGWRGALGKSVVYTPLDFPKKCAWRSAVVGRTKETLFIEAANFELLLGPWQVWFLGHGLLPRPTVKKNRFWTVLWTLTGNLALPKLLNLLVKFMTKEVALRAGRAGLKRRCFFEVDVEFSYSRMPATVELSKVPKPVKYGLANIKNVAFGSWGFVFRRTLVVCPGVMTNTLVVKGFM